MVQTLFAADISDVDHALDPIAQVHESPKLGQTGDRSLDYSADRVLPQCILPRISQRLLQPQRDPSIRRVHPKDNYFYDFAEKYSQGARVKGKVARVADFGAFVELEPGVEGLIHVSEMSWSKKNVKPADILKTGEVVEVVVLGVNAADRRIALGLKQTLGDPWEDALRKYPVGAVVEAPVTSLAKFGAFVDLGDGSGGMIHIGDISREKRLNHPNEALKVGEKVRAQVLEIDRERRRLRLGIKQLEPTSIDEYIGEHQTGEVVSGRLADVSAGRAKVELGEGVFAQCKLPEPRQEDAASTSGTDLSTLTAMLQQKWKSGGGNAAVSDSPRVGQIRIFRILSLDPRQKKIELELI